MWPFSRYISVSSKGILQGMTDCHSHLLPGVDDGVRTAEESLRILEEMERQGIRKLWLTPHIMEDIPNTTDALKTRFRTLCESYRGNIRLELAAEYMLDNLFVRRLEADDILPLHEEKRYLLVETSYFNPPMRLLSMLKHIQEKGYHPLLAHPERYEYMQMADYKALQQAGVAFQLNIPSLAGMYGKHVQKKQKLYKRQACMLCMVTTLIRWFSFRIYCLRKSKSKIIENKSILITHNVNDLSVKTGFERA